MRKLIIASIAILAATTVAEAQNRNGHHGHHNNHRGHGYGHNRNVYVENNYYGRRGGNWNNGGAWAVGLGGLALGAIIGNALTAPAYAAPNYAAPQPFCQDVIIIYPDGSRINQVICN